MKNFLKYWYSIAFTFGMTFCFFGLNANTAEHATKTYYEILGVEPSATAYEIRKAYHNLARETHPDKNRGNEKEAEKKFKAILEAYKTLSNENGRKHYDESLAKTNQQTSTESGIPGNSLESNGIPQIESNHSDASSTPNQQTAPQSGGATLNLDARTLEKWEGPVATSVYYMKNYSMADHAENRFLMRPESSNAPLTAMATPSALLPMIEKNKGFVYPSNLRKVLQGNEVIFEPVEKNDLTKVYIRFAPDVNILALLNENKKMVTDYWWRVGEDNVLYAESDKKNASVFTLKHHPEYQPNVYTILTENNKVVRIIDQALENGTFAIKVVDNTHQDVPTYFLLLPNESYISSYLQDNL